MGSFGFSFDSSVTVGTGSGSGAVCRACAVSDAASFSSWAGSSFGSSNRRADSGSGLGAGRPVTFSLLVLGLVLELALRLDSSVTSFGSSVERLFIWFFV